MKGSPFSSCCESDVFLCERRRIARNADAVAATTVRDAVQTTARTAVHHRTPNVADSLRNQKGNTTSNTQPRVVAAARRDA